jgi:chorismate synthase
VAFVSSVGSEHLFTPSPEHPSYSTNPDFLKMIETIDRETVDKFSPVRCPDTGASERMTKVIENFRDKKDSIGGTVMCVIRNVPVGLGEPTFDKLEAKLGHAMMSLPATKGFEIGSGFAGCEVPGSIHNDAFVAVPEVPENEAGAGLVNKARLTTRTNNSGGIQGGISNGATIYFRTAFKPAATIGHAQTTTAYDLSEGVLEAKGRHDPCVVPRAVAIVEAMSALVIMDALLAQKSREAARSLLPPLPKNLPIKPETSN